MNTFIRTGMAASVIAVALATGTGIAQAAPTGQDTAFLADNEQTNIAEQTIGALAKQRGRDAGTLALAQQTVSDHQAAQTKVTAVAQALSVPLPTTPNATQVAQAAQLQSASAAAFDLTYAQIQVAGHQLAVANTEKEISSGSEPSVIAYAQGYLPVAQMHLQMAQAQVSALGGNPTGVPAGSGGMAATGSSGHIGRDVGLGAGVILVVVGGTLYARGRRRVTAN